MAELPQLVVKPDLIEAIFKQITVSIGKRGISSQHKFL